MMYIILTLATNAAYLMAQLGAGVISAQLSYQPELPECLQEK